MTAAGEWNIDPGGPVDPTVTCQPVDEVNRPAAFAHGAGLVSTPGHHQPVLRVLLHPTRHVVLVCCDDDFWNLPGGQVEPGEDPADTLAREVAEEACARVTRGHYLACQHVWDPEAPDGRTSHYQTRWWARVELEPWTPTHQTVARRLLPPDLVLATLSWPQKAIAARLLAIARAYDQTACRPSRRAVLVEASRQPQDLYPVRPSDSNPNPRL